MTTYNLTTLNNTIASNSLKEELKKRLHNDNEIFYNAAYTNYGGTFMDKVLIEWAKKYHPEDIIFENTSWDGQNGFIFGETAKNMGIDFYEDDISLENMYVDMRDEAIKEATDYLIEDYDIDPSLMTDVHNALYEALDIFGSPLPNGYDYSTCVIIEEAQTILEDNGIDFKFCRK